MWVGDAIGVSARVACSAFNLDPRMRVRTEQAIREYLTAAAAAETERKLKRGQPPASSTSTFES
jgi:hypothetical protein